MGADSAYRTGFTLVELLVVVAIVALLAAMILPGLSRAREYAYFTSCKSSLRQIAIGFLIYAADNTGRLPGTGWPCDGVVGSLFAKEHRAGVQRCLKRIYTASDPQDPLIIQVYDDWMIPGSSLYAWDWNEQSIRKWTGRPRRAGKYLPVEALWDPIVKVRNWGFGRNANQLSGTERERDFLSRRWASIFGYDFFTLDVGCEYKRRTGDRKHVLGYHTDDRHVEEPFRYKTNDRDVSTSQPGSVWISACFVPLDTDYASASYNPPFASETRRRFVSHFGDSIALPGRWRFNIGHLDGHVDDSVWHDFALNNSWTWVPGPRIRPYGYPWKLEVEPGPGYGDGIVEESWFEGAFDDNP
jgi:prepilin-type N-terminal cleavage/methylation domain-containing protein